MVIKIDAIDTLFFRDGKPFTMGADSWADGIFPPSPSVIYGSLRSAYFAQHIDSLHLASAPCDPTRNLVIKNICYQINDTYSFPVPLDCVKKKKTDSNVVTTLTLRGIDSPILGNFSGTQLLKPVGDGEEVEGIPDGLICLNSLSDYMSLTQSSFNITPMSDIVTTEPKIGIGRDNNSHSAQEGKLYRIGMKRLESKPDKDGKCKQLSIIVHLEGLNIPDTGLIKIGGESKAVHYKTIDGPKISVPKAVGKKFKLYLSTPAIFKKGSIPDGINENTLEGEIGGIKVSLVTAAIGKPLHIGGFDIKEKKPKTMRKAVPAGSVYYFECLEDRDLSDALDGLHGCSISNDEHNRKQGFAIVYAGLYE